MAINAFATFEIRNTADYVGAADTNGGGFSASGNTGATGTDYSFANINANGSAKYALTNGQTQGTSIILTSSASTDMIGNIAYIQGGTGSVVANWYQIVNASAGVSITVDRSTGLTAGTGTTINVGGAFATTGGLGAALTAIGAINGFRAYQRYSSTSYTLTSTTSNVSGGIFTAPTAAFSLEGYDQTRGDRTANQPKTIWSGTVGSVTYAFNVANSRNVFLNMVVDGASIANASGFSINQLKTSAIQCIAQNCNGTAAIGFLGLSGSMGATSCKADTCTTGFSAGTVDSCVAKACTNGFLNTTVHRNCLAYTNTTAGFSVNTGCYFNRCTADGNTVDGFITTGQAEFVNCIASNQSGGSGIGFSTSSNQSTMHNCAVYNNTTHVTTGTNAPFLNEGLITLAADPYVNQAGADFRPNNTNPGGAQLRAAGIGVYGQTNNVDIGADQHADPSGGGATSFAY